jgi:hypothetical protein
MSNVIIAILITFICTVCICAKAEENYYCIKKEIVHTRKRISFADGSIWEKREDL